MALMFFGGMLMIENYDKDIYKEDNIPEGCSACGNPSWPDCMDSCPMFDD